MSITAKFIFFQCMILLPFIAGHFLQPRLNKPDAQSKRLIRTNLIFIEPMLVLWSIWGLSLSAELIYLPLSGFAMVLTGMIIGHFMVPLLGLHGPSRSTFIISASLSNHGFTMGGFLCYLLLGEKGLGLSFIFLSYFMAYIFLIIFPFARRAHGARGSLGVVFKDFFLNLQNMPLYALILAIVLRACDIPRPTMDFPVDTLLMLSIGIYYLSLGLNFSIGDLFAFNRDNFMLGLVRFGFIPAITGIVLVCVSWDPSIEAVILIESCMPAAIYSVVASVLFDLDAKRASSMFVLNTMVFLIIILPTLFFLKDSLLGFISP